MAKVVDGNIRNEVTQKWPAWKTFMWPKPPASTIAALLCLAFVPVACREGIGSYGPKTVSQGVRSRSNAQERTLQVLCSTCTGKNLGKLHPCDVEKIQHAAEKGVGVCFDPKKRVQNGKEAKHRWKHTKSTWNHSKGKGKHNKGKGKRHKGKGKHNKRKGKHGKGKRNHAKGKGKQAKAVCKHDKKNNKSLSSICLNTGMAVSEVTTDSCDCSELTVEGENGNAQVTYTIRKCDGWDFWLIYVDWICPAGTPPPPPPPRGGRCVPQNNPPILENLSVAECNSYKECFLEDPMDCDADENCVNNECQDPNFWGCGREDNTLCIPGEDCTGDDLLSPDNSKCTIFLDGYGCMDHCGVNI